MKISTKAILPAPTVRHISLPDSQRVFVIGDLDGHLKRFKESMDMVGFQPNKDKLICLGDIIDRGNDSLAILGLLRDLDALVVLGNHEHLMIESIMGRDEGAKGLWNKNGGQWHKLISEELLIAHCQWLIKQPLSLVVDYRGHRIGLSHTRPPVWDWENPPTNKSKVVAALLWDRELYNKGSSLKNYGVDFSIHGHNSTQIPVWIGSSFHIDTSYYGRPTMVELSVAIEKFGFI